MTHLFVVSLLDSLPGFYLAPAREWVSGAGRPCRPSFLAKRHFSEEGGSGVYFAGACPVSEGKHALHRSVPSWSLT